MNALVAILGIAGACFSLYAVVRMLVALRRGEGRDAVLGWLGLMIVVAFAVFASALLLSQGS